MKAQLAATGTRLRVSQAVNVDPHEVMRLLWKGGTQSYAGRHYTLENARVYSLPEEPPPVYVAAAGDD